MENTVNRRNICRDFVFNKSDLKEIDKANKERQEAQAKAQKEAMEVREKAKSYQAEEAAKEEKPVEENKVGTVETEKVEAVV